MDEITTTDLSKFGARERHMAADLLKAVDRLPDDFDDEGITVMFNMHSGNVFLTNSDFQVAMMNDGKLESFYSCPECGHEGFREDMEHDRDAKGCREYLQDLGIEATS